MKIHGCWGRRNAAKALVHHVYECSNAEGYAEVRRTDCTEAERDIANGVIILLFEHYNHESIIISIKESNTSLQSDPQIVTKSPMLSKSDEPISNLSHCERAIR